MQKKIFKGALTIALLSLTSGILSAFKKGIILWAFKAQEGDIFTAAFVLPDFLFTLIIFGAMSTVFIPIFLQLYKKSKEDAFKYANVLLIFITSLVSVGALLASIFAPSIISIIVPGFSQEAKEITIHLTRIMLLQPIFLGLSSIFGSILQSFHYFFVYALTPVLYQASVILGLTVFHALFGADGFAFGVVMGAALQFAVQVFPALKEGYKISFSFNKEILSKVKETILLTIPRTFGMFADKINFIVMVALASTISQGSVRIFSSAFDIATVVTGLVGISFATAVFPSLAKSAKDDSTQKNDFLKYFSQVFLQILFWSLAGAVIFVSLRAQIVRVIAGYGECNWDCTKVTAATVGLFSLSLFAQSLIPLLSRTFYALKKTAIPVAIGILGNIINISLAFYFINLVKIDQNFYSLLKIILKIEETEDPFLPMVTVLALASTISALIQFIILWLTLDIKLNGAIMSDITRAWVKMIFASGIMAPVMYFSLRIFDTPLKILFPGKTVIPIFLQGLMAGFLGILVYIFIAKVLKIKPVEDIWAILNKKLF